MTDELFTPRLKRNVEEAWRRNKDETGSIYHHPTESGVVAKTIDLTLPRPMREPASPQPSNPSDFDERWLEAYLIDEAKNQNWMLELEGMSWRLLYSQLRFRKEGAGRQISNGQHLILDLLLYDKKARNVVILELKKERDLREANRELDVYNRRLLEQKAGLVEAFDFDPGIGLEEVEGAVSYVVCPALDAGSGQPERNSVFSELDPHYGLFVYTTIDRPWERVANGERSRIKKLLELRRVSPAKPRPWN